MISGLRGLRGQRRLGTEAAANGSAGPEERCDVCGVEIPDEHEHLLHLGDRRILCVCATCWAQRSADPELRPTGTRVVWLDASSSRTSSGPASRSRSGWPSSCAAPRWAGWWRCTRAPPAPPSPSSSSTPGTSSAPSIRSSTRSSRTPRHSSSTASPSQPRYVIAPIDECYGLVGAIKVSWEGISGGDADRARRADLLRAAPAALRGGAMTEPVGRSQPRGAPHPRPPEVEADTAERGGAGDIGPARRAGLCGWRSRR